MGRQVRGVRKVAAFLLPLAGAGNDCSWHRGIRVWVSLFAASRENAESELQIIPIMLKRS